MYNDDGGGNMQPLITMTLKPGVEYLIIVCAYNPHTASGIIQLFATTVS